MRIFLTGPRASGKTTLGKLLAKELNASFADTDAVLGAMLGTSIAEYVAQNGWDAFRAKEHEALVQTTADTEHDDMSVIATGGGIVLLEENRMILQSKGICLYLKVPVEEMVRRLSASPAAAQRPSLTGRGLCEEVAGVVQEREPLYLAASCHVLDGAKAPSEVCENILNLLIHSDLIKKS